MRILNAGCGIDIYGTDFIDKYPKRNGVIRWDADKDKIPFPDNTFDEIRSNWLLEHLRNVGFFLDECFRVLKPGGKIVAVTSNAGYLGFYVSFFRTASKEHYGGHCPHGDDDKHYSNFTTYHLKEHLLASGFRMVETVYYNDKYRWWVILAIKMISAFNDRLGNSGIQVTAYKTGVER